MDDIRTAQDAALERAKDAVASALAGSGGKSPVKRPAAGAAASGPAAKRQRASKRVLGVDDAFSSDSEDEEGACPFHMPTLAGPERGSVSPYAARLRARSMH